MSDYEQMHHVSVEAQHGVATVTLRNAKSMNILGSEAVAQLRRAFALLGEDPGVRAIILRGDGEKAFIGGADVREMAGLDPAEAATFIRALGQLAEEIRQLPQPVIARMAGWCLGGGLEVAAACDIRVASHDARFGMPEVVLGIPSVVHAALLPGLIGEGRSRWLMLTGASIAADDALAWGLVTTVAEPGGLERAVLTEAERFSELDPEVIAEQKRLLRLWADQGVSSSVTESVPSFAAAFRRGTPNRLMLEFLERPRS